MQKTAFIPLLGALLLPVAPAWAANGMVEITSDHGEVMAFTDSQRYIVYANGTVVDSKTKLMWMRCSVGQSWTGSTCAGEGRRLNWKTARQQTASFAGYNDWRIPTIEELRTLTYCSNGKPDYFNNGELGAGEYYAQGEPDSFDFGCQGEPGKDHEQPTIVQSVFPNTPASFFWSASARTSNLNYAWGIAFHIGYDTSHVLDYGSPVRLVRSGQ